MAGFYILRDEQDTGCVDNPMKFPAFPYEVPLVVQDRMFKENGELFYPAFIGDPYWEDFVAGEEATIGDEVPSVLAEFFGDVMTVNG
jgi:spore coat protein A, manganese oxidase